MDKEIFVNQFDLSSTRHCFKLLICLGFSSSIPSVMIIGNESFHTDFDITLAFNRFFASVFSENVAHSAPLQCEVPTIKISDLSLSLSDVRYLLECSDDSNAVGADGILSFLLYQCSNILCTPVFELFSWILKKTNIGLISGNKLTLLLHTNLVHILILLTTVPSASCLNFPQYRKDIVQ